MTSSTPRPQLPGSLETLIQQAASRRGVGFSNAVVRRRHRDRGHAKFALLGFALAAGMTLASPASAVSLLEQEFARWKIQDKCVADAVTAHPDRNAESQRQRDSFVDDCLSKKGMPPRNHVAPPPTDETNVPVLLSH